MHTHTCNVCESKGMVRTTHELQWLHFHENYLAVATDYFYNQMLYTFMSRLAFETAANQKSPPAEVLWDGAANIFLKGQQVLYLVPSVVQQLLKTHQ